MYGDAEARGFDAAAVAEPSPALRPTNAQSGKTWKKLPDLMFVRWEILS